MLGENGLSKEWHGLKPISNGPDREIVAIDCNPMRHARETGG